jgi:hypothetical protein
MTRHQLLRPVLLFDAATCLAMGALLVAASGPVAALTALPASLLGRAGIVLLPFALFVLWSARRGGWAVQAVIALNVAWVFASLGAIAWTQPNGLGIAFVAVQAVSVAAIAALQVHASMDAKVHARV